MTMRKTKRPRRGKNPFRKVAEYRLEHNVGENWRPSGDGRRFSADEAMTFMSAVRRQMPDTKFRTIKIPGS